ncbi:MAG: F0F1 ATP synthase subunit epsilon [Candidatus Omnitrophota bacterium]|jgi:F0F1-type ATP synthase epsilon subunit
MAASYSLKIITPQGVAYEGTVLHTFLPTENGFVGVLAHHAPYLVSSKGGKMVVKESVGLEKDFQVGPGFFEINHDQAVFLSTTFIDGNKQ